MKSFSSRKHLASKVSNTKNTSGYQGRRHVQPVFDCDRSESLKVGILSGLRHLTELENGHEPECCRKKRLSS